MLGRRRRNASQRASRQPADLLHCAVTGQPLTLSGGAAPDLGRVYALGDDCAIDASIIRNILIGISKPDPPQPLDPRGLHIIGAYIRGPLDLDGVTVPAGLRFTACRFDQPMTLRAATLPWLLLDTCAGPGMVARGAKIGRLRLVRCEITGDHPRGAVQLDAAQVTSGLNLTGTTLASSSGPALSAVGLKVGDGDAGLGAVLNGLHARGRAAGAGAVRLPGAQIAGGLQMRGAWLANVGGPALEADGITVHGDLRLARDEGGRPFQATGTAGHGVVLLDGATVSGQLSLEGARVTGVSGGNGEEAVARRRSRGAVCLSGAVVSGDLILRDACLDGGPLPALMAENITVKGHAAACDSRGMGFRASGAGPLGAVCLAGASITGQLALRGTTLSNGSGPALLADLLSAGEGMLLDEDFTATGTGEAGAVRLPDAKINGDLRLNGARLANDSGPALRADGLTVQGDLVLAAAAAPGGPFIASGSGSLGTVLVRGATVGGQLSVAGACVVHHQGPARPGSGGPDPVAEISELAGRLSLEIERNRPVRLDAVAAILAGAGPGAGAGADPGPGAGADPGPDVGPGAGADPGPDAGAVAARPPGAVCLSGTTVGGRLVLRNALLRNASGPALLADYLTVKSDAGGCEQPGEGMVALGAGPLGAVCLAAASISGQLALRGCLLASGTGPALVADSAAIAGDAWLDLDFAAIGTGPHGVITMEDGTVGKLLSCAGAFISAQPDSDGVAGAAQPGSDSVAGGPGLNLTRTKAGTLWLGYRAQAHFEKAGVLRLDGLTYSGVPEAGLPAQPGRRRARLGWLRRRLRRGDPHRHGEQVSQWLTWLTEPGTSYAGQPYAALAAAYGAAGHDDLARVILVAQRDDLRRRGHLSPVRKVAQLGAKWLIGYGYHCFYAFLWLAGLLAVTAAIAVFWLGPARYIQPVTTAAPAAASGTHVVGIARPVAVPECSVAGRAGYALTLAFPVISLTSGSAGQCDVPASGAAPGVLVFGWVVRALAATLFVLYGLGLTGLTRSPPGAS